MKKSKIEFTKVKIVKTQSEPVAVYEIRGCWSSEDMNYVIAFLGRPDLPQVMSLKLAFSTFYFTSENDRLMFLEGFEKAHAILFAFDTPRGHRTPTLKHSAASQARRMLPGGP